MGKDIRYYVIQTEGIRRIRLEMEKEDAIKTFLSSTENILELWKDEIMLIDIVYNAETERYQTQLHRRLYFYPKEGQQIYRQLVDEFSQLYQDV